MQEHSDGLKPGAEAVDPIPYPADVRAKGWRFEIDYEKVDRSDTWDLAAEVPMAQPALLMMWLAAWTQEPCGSMPNDEVVIRAKCRIPPKLWPTLKPILMRDWWLAEDGRLYHDMLVERVLEMLEYRRKNAARVANHAAKKKQSPAANALAAGDEQGNNDTGTGTGTGTSITVIPPTPELGAGLAGGESAKPTKAGSVCKAIKAKGVTGVSPSNPELLALIGRGVSVEVFEAAAEAAIRANARNPMSYLLAVAKGQLDSAAEIDARPAMAQMAWDATRSTIEEKGVEVGVGKWDEGDLSASRETFAAYTERVRQAMEATAA